MQKLKTYNSLGKIVANHEKKQLDEVLYKKSFLKAIALKEV